MLNNVVNIDAEKIAEDNKIKKKKKKKNNLNDKRKKKQK